MNLFTESNTAFWKLQDAWNKLPPDEALQLDQYELEKATGIPSSQWSKFLRDGQVQKFIEQETELFKAAQMRKLIARATTNDKSVGTAQMLNAIGKTLEDDNAEPTVFIYSYVPLTYEEQQAPNVTQDLQWQAPQIIKDEDKQAVVLEKPDAIPDEVTDETKQGGVVEDDWF